VIDLTGEDTVRSPNDILPHCNSLIHPQENPLAPSSLPPSHQMPAWPSEAPEDPDLGPLVAPITTSDNPKPQKPRRTLFRNRPTWAKRYWTPDEDETIEPPSTRAGIVNRVERSGSPEVAESIDEENRSGGQDIRGRSSAGADNPANDDGAPILESQPPAESNLRPLPY
jgi:hypothetical protein